MSSSKILFFLCLSFVGGIFVSSFVFLPFLLKFAVSIAGIILISVFWNFKKAVVFGFCLVFLILGIWRHEGLVSGIKYEEAKNTVVSGMISKEPDIRETHQKITINNTLIVIDKYRDLKYGDFLKVKGDLEAPQIIEDFNYRDYLKKEGIYSVMYFPKINTIERGRGNPVYAKIIEFKDKLRKVINENISPPESSILGAVILGDKANISQEWKENLGLAGVRHLTAVSGMHVAILSSILMVFLIGIGFWRKHAFFATIILISLFIILTGLQPSAIRAGIMGGMFLLSQHLGRTNVSIRALVFAATLMLAFNPLLLKLDIGFQLSFLAVLGIIYFFRFFQNLFRKVPEFLGIRDILAMTFSAQVFTFPLLIYNFGYISLIGPISNILLVPIMPFIMGLGFIFVLAGFILKPLGWLLSLPLLLILNYMTWAVDWLSGLSFSTYSLEVSWAWLVAIYFLLAFLAWRVSKREKKSRSFGFFSTI